MGSRPDGLVPADPALAADLALRLTPEHVREIRETTGMPPGDALLLSLRQSVEAYAFVPRGGGGAAFMMGVTRPDMLTAGALLWMLAAPAAPRHRWP
jgi:hypothetical protein